MKYNQILKIGNQKYKVYLTKDVKGIQTEIRWFSAMIVLVLLGAIATNYL